MARTASTLARSLARSGGSVQVLVSPKSSRNRIEIACLPDGSVGFRVWVTVMPQRGKANKMVLRMLAGELGVPKSHLSIVRGITSRRKLIRVRPRISR